MIEIYNTIRKMERLIGDDCWVEFHVSDNLLVLTVSWKDIHDRLYQRNWIMTEEALHEIPDMDEYINWLSSRLRSKYRYSTTRTGSKGEPNNG